MRCLNPDQKDTFKLPKHNIHETPMQANLNELNREAIEASKEYTGELAWLTIGLTAFVLGAMVLLLWLFAAENLSLWIAIPAYAALTYMSYTPCTRPCTATFTASMSTSNGLTTCVATWWLP